MNGSNFRSGETTQTGLVRLEKLGARFSYARLRVPDQILENGLQRWLV
jgi:hypothetical protein